MADRTRDQEFDVRLGRAGRDRPIPADAAARSLLGAREGYLRRIQSVSNKHRLSLASKSSGTNRRPQGRAKVGGRVVAPGSDAARNVFVRVTPRSSAQTLGLHLDYLSREGTARDGSAGEFYGPDGRTIAQASFAARGMQVPSQYRIIVAPEDGAQYESLQPLTRSLMQRMADELQVPLVWAAIDHYNTGHPHSHIVLLDCNAQGDSLRLSWGNLAVRLRAHAVDLLTQDLGPRAAPHLGAGLQLEARNRGVSAIDAALLARSGADGSLRPDSHDPLLHEVQTLRLWQLQKLRLAQPRAAGDWALAPHAPNTLAELTRRQDEALALQRALAALRLEFAARDRRLGDLNALPAPITGQVLSVLPAQARMTAPSLVIAACDGAAYHLRAAPPALAAKLQPGMLLQLAPGRHHKGPDDQWRAPASRRIFTSPRLQVDLLSPWSVVDQLRQRGPTWLDQMLVRPATDRMADRGFGQMVQQALLQRRHWLAEVGLAPRMQGQPSGMPADLLDRLQRYEQHWLEQQLQLPFTDRERGFSGLMRGPLDLATGRVALVTRARDFTLSRWNPALGRHIGEVVNGAAGPDGRWRWLPGRGPERGPGRGLGHGMD